MKAFSIVAALATAVQAVALIMLHLLPTGYNPVRDAVSDYGVGRYRGWFWLQAVAGGVGCLALGIALAQLHPYTPTQVVVALIVTAGARFLLHGGGLVISRMVNEFGIAKKVAATITEAFTPHPAS